ncbi:MAG: hypothetical protein U0Q16_18110 [Bryobacteraceae bacterium]
MKRVALVLASLTLAATAVWAQAKQPKLKSKKEQEAVMAIFNAQTPDARIGAVEDLLTKFADTEFKSVALQLAAQSAQEKNDFEKMVIYAERTLEADPKNYTAMIMLASGFAQRTREHDLDKEEKLKTAEKYANSAIEVLKTAEKPRPDLDDTQWNNAKKDFNAQALEALGLVAMARKKYDEASKQFQASIDNSATPDAATKVRLAAALNLQQKWDDALKVLEPLLADANLNPAIRQFAAKEKVAAAMGKAKK